MARYVFPLIAAGMIGSVAWAPLFGAAVATPTAVPTQENVRYVGAVNCQSSMCHGGASPSRDQFTIWSHQDFHSRAYATLVTARSVRIADGLGMSSATESVRCTVCHAPFAGIPADHLSSMATPTEGVSCESCHNAASGWLRGHTRTDWSYSDRVSAGMRDLRSAYVRAETCVACHQIIDPDLIKAGHPELTFELDGHAASEPRHWMEKEAWFGPKAWLVGQAVALREIDRQVQDRNDANIVAQEKALIWLLQQVPGVAAPAGSLDHMGAVAAWSNQVAQTASAQTWQPQMSAKALDTLAGTANSFIDDTVSLDQRELRAERLVLALDRLFKSLNRNVAAPGQEELTALFGAVQDRDHFDPGKFSSLLQKFADVVKVDK